MTQRTICAKLNGIGLFTDERRKLYLADIRKIVIEELNKLPRQAGET